MVSCSRSICEGFHFCCCCCVENACDCGHAYRCSCGNFVKSSDVGRHGVCFLFSSSLNEPSMNGAIVDCATDVLYMMKDVKPLPESLFVEEHGFLVIRKLLLTVVRCDVSFKSLEKLLLKLLIDLVGTRKRVGPLVPIDDCGVVAGGVGIVCCVYGAHFTLLALLDTTSSIGFTRCYRYKVNNFEIMSTFSSLDKLAYHWSHPPVARSPKFLFDIIFRL
mmetsp:Transcript_12947/g.15811  ORF Transcript_12947/g.15811 Transcript_12947/m.15811 type:complete len:219 (-) Transcript_12947:82-738(-)